MITTEQQKAIIHASHVLHTNMLRSFSVYCQTSYPTMTFGKFCQKWETENNEAIATLATIK